ncbi:MAG TPA: phosphate-starvation-inducible PsiE family protein [Candidatus Saccharimonadales bacterium]|nr:phosphate-starvation-inducible PsiE family protein [Candidatus Saccharimonadales bacterium]
MKLIVNHENLFERLAIWLSTFIRLALNVLLIVPICALVVGIGKAGIDLFHALRQPLDVILQNVLLDTVFILAVVEITITLLGYLKDGRVHVRYIVDTILIIMLNEIVSMWFRHPKLDNAIGLSIIIVALALVRVSVIRFSPRHDD